MTVGLSDCSFEISDLLIYVVTYIRGFRISVASCAGCSQAPPRRRGCRAFYTIRHTTYRCITELYLQPCDDICLLGKGPNEETRDILMPNELKKYRTFNTTIRLTMKSSYRLTRRPTQWSYYVTYNLSILNGRLMFMGQIHVGMNLKAINRCI